MQVLTARLGGVVLFRPSLQEDERGLYARTFDASVARAAGLDPAVFVHDAQFRMPRGVLRGLHGRVRRSESKLVRCARGAVHDVLVDIRPGSSTFGAHEAFRLDDANFAQLYVPPGFLHGFQALTETTDVCVRLDRESDPFDEITVRYDDPDLAIEWPLPVTASSHHSPAIRFADLQVPARR